MPAGICLKPETVDAFKQALKSGKIHPDKLSKMTSEERHALLSSVIGEGNAKFVNAQFESKLLLKNQQRGYLTWLKKTTGVTPEVRRDLISRIQKMDKVLNPAEEKAFLKDLASTKLGIDVTAKEAKQIADMSAKLQELEAKRRPDNTFPSEKDRMAYGYAKFDLGEHISGLKNAAEKSTIKEIAMHPIQSFGKVAGFTKAIRASLDDSAVFRQGWKTLWTNPIIWQKNARASLGNLYKSGIRKQDVVREVMADIVSRPNYDKYAKMKLALGNIEEQFPTDLPSKIPLLGRAYHASEQAYEAFLYKTRADVADKMLQVADKSGVDITDKTQLSSMGKLINALTGRGDIGHGKAASPIVNNAFFSIRFVKSNFDTLTAHQFQKGVTPFVRKQAAENLAKVVLGTAGIIAIADHVKPGSVELDPRSKDFGKIKIGHTRFDITAGMGSMVTLAAQIYKNQQKSTSTGIVTNFGQGYGSSTAVDAINNYFENKLSPVASVIKDLVKRQDFNGNKPTIKNEAGNLFVPLPIQTATSAKGDPQAANQLLISIADGMGIATNNQQPQRNLGNQPLSKTQQSFKDTVGTTKFNQANADYNKRLNAWMAQHQDELNSLPQDEQQTTLATVRSKIQNKVYKQYNFKAPKSTKASGKRKTLLESAK